MKSTGPWISDILSEPQSIRTSGEQSSHSIIGLRCLSRNLIALERVGSGWELARSGHPHPRVGVIGVVDLLYVAAKRGANYGICPIIHEEDVLRVVS